MRLATILIALSGITLTTALAATPYALANERCPDSELVPRSDTLADARDALLCVINEERSARGLVRFKANRRLAIAARRHSRQMVKRHFFAHDGLDGRTFVDDRPI